MWSVWSLSRAVCFLVYFWNTAPLIPFTTRDVYQIITLGYNFTGWIVHDEIPRYYDTGCTSLLQCLHQVSSSASSDATMSKVSTGTSIHSGWVAIYNMNESSLHVDSAQVSWLDLRTGSTKHASCDREPCKNGWTNPDTIWYGDS